MRTNFVNEVEVLYKPRLDTIELTKVVKSADVVDFLRKIWADDIEYRERFYAVYLNRNNKILGYYLVSMGSSCGTVTEPKMIFQPAICMHASTVIIAHNHPSGNTKPSDTDLKLTSRLCKAGQFLEIPILEHIILTKSEFYSFSDNGNLNY
jgi:DNA repair protein RadC